jgi:hypothetical protein
MEDTMNEWVALDTFLARDDRFYEEGGIYEGTPLVPTEAVTRPLRSGERIVRCPRCGQRFAGTDEGSPEANRDLHVNGDEDCPSICVLDGSPDADEIEPAPERIDHAAGAAH